MADEPEAIIEAIRTAFAGVPRGRITLHEAEVLDLYGSVAERKEARRRDTEESWDQVPDRDIEECTTALCYLDPEGWRYYLPAYMIWSLRHFRVSNSMASDATIYTLNPHADDSEFRDGAMDRFRRLDLAQSRTVCRFLRTMAANDEYADGYMAQVALDAFWSRFSAPRAT